MQELVEHAQHFLPWPDHNDQAGFLNNPGPIFVVVHHPQDQGMLQAQKSEITWA